MSKIVVTGGAGFIGSHVAEHLRDVYPDSEIIIFDKMTYSADMENIDHILSSNNVRLVVGDICDIDLCRKVLDGASLLVHLAAESHVDNSFGDSLSFTRTNTLGTHSLLEVSRTLNIPQFIHISTDEVYGEVLDGAADEDANLKPTNPYSASKASAEMLVMSYIHSFNVPIIRIRANNIFGFRQYPEKLLPRCCLSLIRGEKIPLHGDGSYRRHYLDVRDFAEAVSLLIDNGNPGEVYNIGSPDEFTNLEVAEMVSHQFGADPKDHIEFVHDRPFNDRRYSISSKKIEALGWCVRRHLREQLPSIAEWYKENAYRYGDF